MERSRKLPRPHSPGAARERHADDRDQIARLLGRLLAAAWLRRPETAATPPAGGLELASAPGDHEGD